MGDAANPPWIVRDAAAADTQTIVEFNRLLAVETENKVLDVAVLERGVARALASPELCRYFVADLDGRMIGQTMLTYEWSDWRCAVFWWIQSVYVETPHRGRGVFRSLHEHIRRLAEADPGVCGLRLYVEHENRPAQSTYQRLGLAPTGHLMYEHDWSGAVGERSQNKADQHRSSRADGS